MSIEKKSLISNRIATKKAIVTKPGVTKLQSPKSASSTRLEMPRAAAHITRLAIPKVIAAGPTKVVANRLKSL